MYKLQLHSYNVKCVFIKDNAPSRLTEVTLKFSDRKGFTEEKSMEWAPTIPDVNPFGNLWTSAKTKLYETGKQYESKTGKLKTMKTILTENQTAEVNRKN